MRLALPWGVVALGLTVGLQATAASPAGAPAFQEELPAAIAAAAQRHQPVFVHFSAPWCEPCQRMKRDLYTLPAVADRLARFIRVEVDTDTPAGAQAWMDYRLPGLPVVALLQPDGTELLEQRLTGVPDEARLLAALDVALAAAATPERLAASAPPAPPAPSPSLPSDATAPPAGADGLLPWLAWLAGLVALAGSALWWRRGALRGRRASSGSPPPST